MRTQNTPFLNQKEYHPKLSQICSYGIFSEGTQEHLKQPW